MNILIIEDERKVAEFISKGLREFQHTVDVAFDGVAGEAMANRGRYDLIILDLMLPQKNGYHVLTDLRKKNHDVKILLLSALDQVEDKIRGLKLGADDYLTKPFDFDELLARIEAILRRGNYESHDVLVAHDLTFDRTTQTVVRSGKRIELTAREYRLLEFLLLHKNEVVTRTMIAQHVWNFGFDTNTNVINVYINYLRRKVDEGFSPPLIHTIRSRGYRILEE